MFYPKEKLTYQFEILFPEIHRRELLSKYNKTTMIGSFGSGRKGFLSYIFKSDDWDSNRLNCIRQAIDMRNYCLAKGYKEITLDYKNHENSTFSIRIYSIHTQNFIDLDYDVSEYTDEQINLYRNQDKYTWIYESSQKSKKLKGFESELIMYNEMKLETESKIVRQTDYKGRSYQIFQENLALI